MQASDGEPRAVEFLVDIGADRTVLCAATAKELSLALVASEEMISGLGGTTETAVVETVIQLWRETGVPVSFHGQFTAVTDAAGLEMNVLGRDIMDLFAVIVDRPGNVVCMLSQRHRYAIIQD